VPPTPPAQDEFRPPFSDSTLRRLDDAFLERLAVDEPALHARLLAGRAGGQLPAAQLSALLLAVAPRLEAFIAGLLRIEPELAQLQAALVREGLVGWFREEFVKKRVRRHRPAAPWDFAAADGWLTGVLAHEAPAGGDRELAIAQVARAWSDRDDGDRSEDIERLVHWCALALSEPDGRAAVSGWLSFHLPAPVDPDHLVALAPVADDRAGRACAPAGALRARDGFGLTDPRMSQRETQGEVHYCVYCHDHAGDFCSRGFPEKKSRPDLGFKVNGHGVVLTGCPLEEKISEMHSLRRDGAPIAALAVAMADNPMIPATGHRICNDCMKACIYQKQDPVNIPQVETGVLNDVLRLPWGVEIYDLLARWNPLRMVQFLPQPDNGRRVLVSGMGPAGFTMAHHLTMEGCAVFGIDGLKIEPLHPSLVEHAVRDYAQIEERLDDRILAGFGGVAEYGITVRWDKNFLKLIYLTLARRHNFRVAGGVRLGGTVTLEDAWRLGFDHLCVATGAGLPRVIALGNSMARGMRQASDFLMALQLTGAAKASSLANLQVRLPAVVIGGGLTAVDTATEVQAYYVVQVEKTLRRYEELCRALGDQHVRRGLDPESVQVLDEFLAHGRAVAGERERAAREGRTPDFTALLRQWGGVTLTYRRRLHDSPAYRRNHEEVAKALEEGIFYAEQLEPVRTELDGFGHVARLVCRHTGDGSERTLEARAILVAAGAVPNTIYEREHPGTFIVDGDTFRAHQEQDGQLVPVAPATDCKTPHFGALTSYRDDGHRVSFIGDTHPVFHGSVVRAIASARRSYPAVVAAMSGEKADSRPGASAFLADVAGQLRARISAIDASHPSVVEVWVRAPLAAANYRPGQFFRLQTFESRSAIHHGTRLQVPLQTVSGAGVRGDEIRLLVLRGGPNARLIERLAPGEEIVLMGPTGAPAHIVPGRTVLAIAGKWGAAAMLDLGRALRAAGCRVLLFAAFSHAREVFHQDELEAACDQIVWCTTHGPRIDPRRPADTSTLGGDIVKLLAAYGAGDIPGAGPDAIRLNEVDEILVMGSTGMLGALQHALRGELRGVFRPGVEALGTVGSPMQCMLKGVCAQCLQWQVDPETGERTHTVFSCAMQDQPLFAIDVENLRARQGQNRLQEYLTGLWLDYVLDDAAREGAGG